MSTAEHRYCYRHPDRETGLSCSECERPICPECATFAPVGIRCPDHAGARGGKKPRQLRPPAVRRAQGMALSTGAAPVTYGLIALNLVIFLVTVAQDQSGLSPYLNPRGLYLHGLLFGPFVANGDWYRLVTAMFLHAAWWHVASNMFALYWIGAAVERYLGPARYVGLYFVSGLAGSAGALLVNPTVPVVGASGAIFGVLGSMMILEWQVTGRLAGQAFTLIAINLLITFAIPGISIGGHIGGLVGGILVTLGYAHWRGGRAEYGKLGLGGVVGLVAVAAASVAIAYFKVRGYA